MLQVIVSLFFGGKGGVISGQTNQKHLSLVMLFCVTVSVGVVPVN